MELSNKNKKEEQRKKKWKSKVLIKNTNMAYSKYSMKYVHRVVLAWFIEWQPTRRDKIMKNKIKYKTKLKQQQNNKVNK